MEIWGVLNVTPDSFSDGGKYVDLEKAVRHALNMEKLGADVIDIGGQSTRPRGVHYGMGAEKVSASEELLRVIPVIREISKQSKVRISIDTMRAEVAKQAIEAGASIVNDVSSVVSDEMLQLVAEKDVEIVLMHNRGKGETSSENTSYESVVDNVYQELELSLHRALKWGVQKEKVWIDPGIGFAKTTEQSVQVLQQIKEFKKMGCRFLVAASKKTWVSEIGVLQGLPPLEPSHRLGGSIAVALWSMTCGANAVRVHDVLETKQAVEVWRSLHGMRAFGLDEYGRY